MSRADDIFDENIRTILSSGYTTMNDKVRPHWADDGAPAYTYKAFAIVNRYDLSKEFPMFTQRWINFKAAVDELLWIWQKKSNNVHDLNSHIWDSWADETGSIGKAYGRIMTNIYVHQDLHEMNLYPCAYSMTFNVTGNKLNAILNQRSNDMLVANAWNVCQYAVLVHLFARCTGLEVGEFVHVIADAHIYDRHVDIVKELIERPKFAAPKLVLTEGITDFYKFTVDDINLEGYEAGPKIKGIPVAV